MRAWQNEIVSASLNFKQYKLASFPRKGACLTLLIYIIVTVTSGAIPQLEWR